MAHQILQGDDTTHPGFSLMGASHLALTLDDTGTNGFTLDFLVLDVTVSVRIASTGATGGFNLLPQLAETTNDLTTVTISGSEAFVLGDATGQSNSGDGVVTDIAATATSSTLIHSSLTLVDASTTTGGVTIYAGATNTSGEGAFDNGASLNANVTITYTGLKIRGGSGNDFIENDAKNGVVTDGHGTDTVILGGPGATATLGKGTGDVVYIGFSSLGTNEAPGSALGDSVQFGIAPTATLIIESGAEAGSTAGTTRIGLTNVIDAIAGMNTAEAGMNIDFTHITTSSYIDFLGDFEVVAPALTLTAAENQAVAALGGPGIAYFIYGDNEFVIATNNTETTVSSNDAIVKLVGVYDLHATNAGGVVTLIKG
jgi:hypothetical protein